MGVVQGMHDKLEQLQFEAARIIPELPKLQARNLYALKPVGRL